jgi:hypothetical protein
MGQQITTEASEIVSAHYDVVYNFNCFRGFVLRDRIHDARKNVSSRYTQCKLDIVFLDGVAGKLITWSNEDWASRIDPSPERLFHEARRQES